MNEKSKLKKQKKEGNPRDEHNELLNKSAILFLNIYVVGTILWIISFAVHFEIGRFKFELIHWNNYICYMLLAGVIHVWLYATSKTRGSNMELPKLFSESKEYKDRIVEQFKRLLHPIANRKDLKKIEKNILFVYIALWITIVSSISYLYLELGLCGPIEIDFNKNIISINDIVPLVNFILLFEGLVLNGFSYYFSVVYCFFVREIANGKNIKCDSVIPWNSANLRHLINISSRSSLSFFAVSFMYVLCLIVCLISVEFKIPSSQLRYWELLIAMTVSLCFISFLIITLLPKAFLNRRFRSTSLAV